MLGIIILNYETWELSLRCMQSLMEQDNAKSFQIYLVDNASKAGMPKTVKDFITQYNVTYISSDKNRGYAAGNNLGIRRALQDGCDALLISNNDIVYRKGAVWALYDTLKEQKDIGIAGPKVLDEKGLVQPSRIARKTGMREIFQLYTVAKLIFRKSWKTYFCLDRDVDKMDDVYHVSGCCFMISAECAKQVLPFDETTVLYGEELILGVCMERAGYRTVYQPKSVVVHKHGATTKRVKPFMYQCISESELYYCSRYLRAPRWQLRILYVYRRLLYKIRALRKKELREYYPQYKAYMRAKWREWQGSR